MLRVCCPLCGRKLRIPDHLAGRRVSCHRCEEPVRIPRGQGEPESAPSPTGFADEFPLPARLGMASVALRLLSVMALCLPFVGVVAVGLSGLGVLLGAGAVFTTFRQGAATLGLSSRFGSLRHGGAALGRVAAVRVVRPQRHEVDVEHGTRPSAGKPGGRLLPALFGRRSSQSRTVAVGRFGAPAAC
jgi:hypothetical protein